MTINLAARDSNGYKVENSQILANVFKRKKSNQYEYLSEIGLFLGSAEGVEVYVNPNSDELTKGKLVATYTGSNALEAGYHTLKPSSPILLTGEKFVVKVKYINSNYNTRIPLECNLTSCEFTDTTDNITAKAVSNAGESFISNDNENWSDLSGYKYKAGNSEYTIRNSNACIKAFTTVSTTLPTISVIGVTLDNTLQTIKIGYTFKLIVTVSPTNATNKVIIWSENIAKVSNGIVTGIGEGTAMITVTTKDGSYKTTCETKVEKTQSSKTEEPTTILVKGITLNKEEETVQVGDVVNLVATITPIDVTNKNVTWTSSNESVAIISSTGIIKALKEGTSQITATTNDGSYKASCKITVVEKTNSDDDIYTEQGNNNKDNSNTINNISKQSIGNNSYRLF